jgi:hypothetical protein
LVRKKTKKKKQTKKKIAKSVIAAAGTLHYNMRKTNDLLKYFQTKNISCHEAKSQEKKINDP